MASIMKVSEENEDHCGDSNQFYKSDVEYQQRVQRLQYYVPFLKKMIEHLEGAKDKNREAQLMKMRSLLNIITDSNKKLKLETIQRCEEVLQKLYSKVEGAFEWSTGLPNVHTKICIEIDKFNPEREEIGNYNRHSPLIESPDISSRDGDSMNNIWKRNRKTASDFFEETPRSPSPPASPEINDAITPVMIPMERKEESQGSKPVIIPLERTEPPEPKVIPLERQEESLISKPLFIRKESKVSRSLSMPFENEDTFEARWYKGDIKTQEMNRSMNNFVLTNSLHASEKEAGLYSGNLQQNSFSRDILTQHNNPNRGSNNVPDVSKLDEICSSKRKDGGEYQGYDKNLHIPFFDGGERWSKDGFERRPSKEWTDNTFEGRKTPLGIIHQSESPRFLGPATFFDYGHGQNSPCADSSESTRESLIESEAEKNKLTSKSGNMQRVSLREKLALEINKVHRVGVSSGGALRSLCKDLGSPPHQRKVENREGLQNRSAEKERRPSDPRNFSEEGFQTPTEINSLKPSDFKDTDSLLSSKHTDVLETENSKSSLQDKSIKDSFSSSLEKSISRNVNAESSAYEKDKDHNVIEEFSFRKKRLDQNAEAKGYATLSDDEDESSKMSICDDDSDPGSKIPFLDLADLPPPRDVPTFAVQSIPPLMGTDPRYISSQSLSSAPYHSVKPQLQPFINPSNPNINLSQGTKEDSIQPRNWPSQGIGNSRVGPQGYQPNLLQHNGNPASINASGHIVQHNINPSSHMVPPNVASPNQVSVLESNHRGQSQYMDMNISTSHNLHISKPNQNIRPHGKVALLPDPVPGFRPGQTPAGWSSMQKSDRYGLLPHPVQQQAWRNDSYSRPNINQSGAEYRHSSEGRGSRGRGGWNSRRGGFPKINDPRLRKSEHTRNFSALSTDKKYKWKHPADPRRASPVSKESKRSAQSVPKEKSVQKETDEVSSPLNSLYDAEQAPKTGKGYGFQKFRIPKIKSAEQIKNNTHVKTVPTPGEVQKEKDVVENLPQDKIEEAKKEEIPKTKEDITKGLFETLLTMSLSTGEGTKILENSKFLEELREKLNLNRPKKTRPIIESDSESDEEEVKPTNAVSKGKKRSRLIIESSDSENSREEKDDVIKSSKKSPVKTPTSARRTPRSCRLTNQTPNADDSPGGRPRTRSQRKLFSVEEEDEKKEKNEEEMEDSVTDEVFPNEEKKTGKHNDNEKNDDGSDRTNNDNRDDERSHEDVKTKTAARRTKRRSSLELLQEDIREMFICEGVMSATGVRMCRLLKEAASVSHSNEDLAFEADASRDLGDWDEKSNASGKEETSVDQSEDSFEEVTKLSKKQGSKKDEVTSPSSLQPRVVLKKAEINMDVKNLETVQNSRRGRALARRSRKKPLNIGDRVASNCINFSGGEDGPEENVADLPLKEADSQENSTNDFTASNEVLSSNLVLPSNSIRESKSASKSTDSGSKDTTKEIESPESPKLVAVEESLEKKECLQNKCVVSVEKQNDDRLQSNVHELSSDNEVVSTSNGKENEQGKDDVIDKTVAFVNEEKMSVSGTKDNLKKQKMKKKSKVNRRWALGILKKAVNHKRRNLTCLPMSSAHSTQYTADSSVDQNQSVDLTDVNYFCNGSENVKCKLCSYQGKQIVGHYVTKHPESEVLVSRLSPEQAKIAWDWTEANKGALKNAKLALTSSGPFVCLICEMWLTDYMEFYDHVTTHTGEYRYNCKTCAYRSFRCNNVRSHSYYVHHKKWCENSDCFTVSTVEPLVHENEEEDKISLSLSSVIPGLVAHLCSKCHYIQISEKRLEDHIKNMHKGEDMPKVLKIDLSVIAPESPSASNEKSETKSLPQDSFKASSDIGNDEVNSSFSCDNSVSLEKEKPVEEKAEVLKTEDKIKKEEESIEDMNVSNELDSCVFCIDDNNVCESELMDNSKEVWLEVQDTPEFDDEVSIIDVKLNVCLKKDEEKKLSISESIGGNADVKEEEVNDDLPVQSFDEKRETETASSNLVKEDVSKSVVVEGKEIIGRDNDAESHVSEVEIIEINDDSENSIDSESSYTDSSSSEDEMISDSIENTNKENLFALEMLPDVKIQTNLVDLTNKISHSIKNNVIEIDSVSLSEDLNSKINENIEEDNFEEAQEPLLDVNESSGTECDPLAEKPQKFKIRVRCLSGDLLSSTKESNTEDSLISSEQDPYIDVLGTSPVFKPDAENTLCQISSVCSLHPNEKVPEDFIKAVSENETPDLKTLAAYSPTPSPAPVYFLASSNFNPPQPIPNISSSLVLIPDRSKTSRVPRPILPKPVISSMCLNDIPGLPSKESTLKLQDASNGKDFPSEIRTFPKKNLFGETSSASTACHSSTQPKVCSIMRASLYAKASKTPLVFNQVMNNQMKLCHLFKCMGRQCSFTTDDPMVFHSHYLGHESQESGAVSSTSGSSGENIERQERKFDWQQCSYCAEMFSSANDYVKHVQTEHGECIYQCPYCFYRAAAVSYVILHQNSTHITEKVSVLHCKSPGKGTSMNKDSTPTKPNIEAYICYQGNCKRSFYSPTKYLSHLQLEHFACSIYCCHKCSFQCLKADRLLQHYKLHSFYLYQCVYCEQGSDTSEEILQHLASFHPNKRATVCKRNSQVNSNGSARTTGRHVYILYEDIELTEMDDVDVVPVENLASKNLVTSSPVNSNDSLDKKTEGEHSQNETDLDFDDGNSDYEDDDNLIIAEDPEEITGNTNQSTIEEDSEIIEIDEISTDVVVDDQQYIDVTDDPCKTYKNKERVVDKKMIDSHDSEELLPLKDENNAEYFSKKKLDDISNPTQISKEKDTAISLLSDDEIIEIDSDKTKSSFNDNEIMEVSLQENSRNADDLVSNSESKTRMSTTKKLPSISKREDYRRRSSSLLQDEQSFKNKIKDSNSISKKNISLKEAANSKIDRANLYKCCFSNCPFLGKDSNHLKHHIKICSFSKDQVKYECPHCKRIYKHLPSLLKHYRMHSKKSFVCMICKYQGSHASNAVQHVKSKHRATSTTVSPLTDWQEPDDIPLTSKDHKLIVVAPKEVSMSFLLRKRFLPEDADYLPFPCIYNREAKCARCSYSTKIRSNMRRHLHLHLKFNQGGRDLFSNANSLGSNQVPWSDKDLVNPMPCLEGKEMMFDKMTNWAMSSHLDENVKEEEVNEGRRDSTISNYEEDNFIPRFVPENERYVCGVIGCHYQTVDDMMLRHHLRALHREETTFRCAHCPDDPTIIHQVPVDRLAAHLKMHDDRLYQCIHCNYFHFQRRFVERHTLDKHSDLGQEVNVIREPDTFARASTSAGTSGMAGTSTDGSIRSSNPANDSVKSDEENLWHCGLCSYSCTNRESISDHARISHSISSQYLCGMCSFRSAYLASFTSHFSSKHPGYPVQLIANYFRHNISVLASPSITIILPNGKVIHPPGPQSSKSDPRSEPVIEVWPFVEKGFGKSSSSAVRLKELNTTYPWQRCMPRVRYIRGIPIADEGEETMYDLSESLKVKEADNKPEQPVEEDSGKSSQENNSEKKKMDPVVKDEVTIVEIEDSVNVSDNVTEPNDVSVKRSLKRRQSDSDASKSESCSPEKKKADNVRSRSTSKDSMPKKACDRIFSGHQNVSKIPKLEPSLINVNSNDSKEAAQESVEDKALLKGLSEEKDVFGKVNDEKQEYLLFQYGKFGKPDQNLFVCPKCQKYKTKYKADMKEHLFRELNYKRFVCTHCGLMSPTKSRLQKHYVRVHQKDGKPEAIATLPPDEDIEIWVHFTLTTQMKIMKELKTLKTNIPDEVEGISDAISTEFMSPSEDNMTCKNQYRCKHCPSKFSTVRGLKIHIKIFHLKLGSWICGHCDVTANAQVIISKHSKSAHPDKEELVISNSLGSFTNSKFWQDYGLLESQESPKIEPAESMMEYSSDCLTLKCSLCNYETEQRDEFTQHQRQHSSVKPYICGSCDYCADQECDIKSHFVNSHPFISPKVLTKLPPIASELMQFQSCKDKNGIANQTNLNEDSNRQACGDVEVMEQNFSDEETLITMGNIGECENPNLAFIFKCFYCRMRSFSCSDVLNHWENVHHNLSLPLRKMRPFKCKKMAMKKMLQENQDKTISSGQDQIYHCAYCQESGRILHLKEHFISAHPESDFKVGNVGYTSYHCLECKYMSCSLAVLADHFEVSHPSKNFQYEVKSENSSCKNLEDNKSMTGGSLEDTKNANENLEGVTEEFLKGSIYRCYWCNEEFLALKTVKNHHCQKHTHSPLKYLIEVKMNKIAVDPKPRVNKNVVRTYHCPSCPIKMKSLPNIFEHLRMHTLPFKCGTCGFSAEVPSRILDHHIKEHPHIPTPAIDPDLNAETEMSKLWNKIKVTEEPSDTNTGGIMPFKRYAVSPPMHTAKKHCPVARKSTTQVFPPRSVWKATARKSTNSSPLFIKRLQGLTESSKATINLSSEVSSLKESVVNIKVERESEMKKNEEYSYYSGGKGISSDPVELSRITVWMTFGGCAAKRVQVSKMAQLVDLSPNLRIEDIIKSKQSQEI